MIKLYHRRFTTATVIFMTVLLFAGHRNCHAQTGTVSSSVVVSEATPVVGSQITATIYVDMTGVSAPDNVLGSFTGSMTWDTDILTYVSNSGLSGVFSGGAVNPGTGIITFSSAIATGASGNISLLTVTFDVTGEGTGALDLSFTAMAATPTVTNLLPVLTITDGSVTASGGASGVVEADGAASSATGAANAGSISFAHTTGTGTNRLMLVGVSWNAGSTAMTISSVTFTPSGGGSALPLTAVITEQAGTNLRYSAIYSLLNPPSGVAGTVAVTFSETVSNGIVAGAANFKGADQTTPLGTAVGASGSSTAASVTLSGLSGNELVFDNLFQGASGSSQTVTAGAGQTPLWNAWISNTRAAASTGQAAGSSVTMSWTAASSTPWAIAAVPVNPAPAGPSYTLTVSDDGNGSVTLDPSGGTYASGTTVTLTPVPEAGYEFSAWTGPDAGDIVETGGVYTIVMNSARSVTANFTAIPVVLPEGEVSYKIDDDVQTFNFSHTTGSGINRLLMVGVSWNSDAQERTISSVTFTPDGGSAVSLSEAITQKHGSNNRYSAIYSLVNPVSNTTGTITVTFSEGTVTAGIVAGAANFAGVDQITPLGPSAGAYSPSNNTTVTVTVSGLNGNELVFDNVFQGGNPPSALTPDASQTQLGEWNANVANVRGAASIEQAATSSVTMSWTAASSSLWVTAAVAINPAPAGPSYTLTVSDDGNGSVTLDPSGGTYASGTTVTLTPVPGAGYEFSGWTGPDAGDIVESGGVYTIEMDADKSVTANFTPYVPGCQVNLDGSASSGTWNDAVSVDLSHTTGTGPLRLMLAGISWNCGATDRTITGVEFRYGAGPAVLPMNSVITQMGTNSSGDRRYSAIYSLADPPAGVTGTVRVTFSGSVGNGIVAGAVNFSGVDQANPLGVPAGAAETSGAAPTVTLSGLSGYELVFDNVFQGGSSSSQTLTAPVDQTQLWNDFNTNTRAASSIEQATGSTVTMSWTANENGVWAIAAVPVRPAPAGTWLGITSDWNNQDNWCGAAVPGAGTNVTIGTAAANFPVIPSSPYGVCNNLTVNAGASLTVAPGQALTVNGELVSNGTVTVQSDGTLTGSLIVTGTSTGNVTFNRSLNPVGYHYFSSPVALSALPSTVYEYSEGTDSWESTSTYVEGKGYAISGAESLSLTGTVVTDPVQITATSPYSDPFTGGGDEYSTRTYVTGRDPDLGGNYGGGGWNLLGNPYTSSINVVDFLSANYNTDPAISRFDPNYVALYLYNGTSYVFVTGDDVTGWTDPNTYDDGIGQLSSAYLQAGQGFFVLAMRNGVSFNFNRDMQEHSTSTLMLKSAGTKDRWPGLSLKVAGGGTEKRTLIVFNEKMTTGLDPLFDVGQMGSGGAVNIYTHLVDNNGVNFSRQALPESGAVKNIIPVGVDFAKGGSVTFSAEVEPLRNYKYWLEDRVTGAFTDLRMNSYTVDLPANTYGTGRFFVHVTTGRPDRPGKQHQAIGQIKIWSAQNREIHIQGSVGEKAVCEVYDIHGHKIYETLLTDAEYNVITVPYRKKGVYVVNVRDGSVLVTQKVVL